MIEALALAIQIIFQILWWAIIIRVLLSFAPMFGMPVDPYHPIIRFLYSITDPILEPLRPYTTIQMIDLSPIVALVGLRIVEFILLTLLGVS